MYAMRALTAWRPFAISSTISRWVRGGQNLGAEVARGINSAWGLVLQGLVEGYVRVDRPHSQAAVCDLLDKLALGPG
eukprot:7482471-Heterocapsa_arctica.AAC.1